jgi:hypothetical protein
MNGFGLVFSRVWALWAVMNIAPPAQTSIFFTMACTSWATVEVPRYLFYALNLLDSVPYPIFWLRYSLFAVLYPTGITGELGCMYYAGLYLYETKVSHFHPQYSIVDYACLILNLTIYTLSYAFPQKYVWGKPFLNVSNIQISVIENLEVSLLLLIVVVAVTYIPGTYSVVT